MVAILPTEPCVSLDWFSYHLWHWPFPPTMARKSPSCTSVVGISSTELPVSLDRVFYHHALYIADLLLSYGDLHFQVVLWCDPFRLQPHDTIVIRPTHILPANIRLADIPPWPVLWRCPSHTQTICAVVVSMGRLQERTTYRPPIFLSDRQNTPLVANWKWLAKFGPESKVRLSVLVSFSCKDWCRVLNS